MIYVSYLVQSYLVQFNNLFYFKIFTKFLNFFKNNFNTNLDKKYCFYNIFSMVMVSLCVDFTQK